MIPPVADRMAHWYAAIKRLRWRWSSSSTTWLGWPSGLPA